MALIKSEAYLYITITAPPHVLRFINVIERVVSESKYIMTKTISNDKSFRSLTKNNNDENKDAVKYLSNCLFLIPEVSNTILFKRFFINPVFLQKENESKEIIEEIKTNVLSNVIQNHLAAITKTERNAPASKAVQGNPGERVNAKPVMSIDKTGNLIKYKSIGAAARQSKTDMSKISDCINGRRKRAGGMQWKLDNEINCTTYSN